MSFDVRDLTYAFILVSVQYARMAGGTRFAGLVNAMLSPEAIKAKAAELGFDLCGIASADQYPELSFLDEWLQRGYHGEMAWMSRSRERRLDVRNVLPGARSVVATATLYNTDRPYAAQQPPDVARLSRYAWGDDYHHVIKLRLDRLLEWMHSTSDTPFEGRAYVDTGPVQERVYAQYAGLGWIGKNTCLINREIGSWLFLGEIICTLPLAPDAQGLEQCGSCTRCLDACPTRALVEPGVLDSNRCLSYLTIELRSSIPEEHRPSLGGHVYGCDICQEVCPYNQPAPSSSDAPWQPRAGLDLPRLVDLWRRPDSELRASLKGSAMTRAKLVGLRRNLAVALGNRGDRESIDALQECADDRPSSSDPLVREHVTWAVDRARKP
jgi:epoxyqueuosine reductase